MSNKYNSFGPWTPLENEFPYDKSILEQEGYVLRARLNKKNKDMELLCCDLEKEKKEVKVIDIKPENKYVDVWYKEVN